MSVILVVCGPTVWNFGNFWRGCNSGGHPQNSKPPFAPQSTWTSNNHAGPHVVVEKISGMTSATRPRKSIQRRWTMWLCGWSLLVKCDTVTYATFIWYYIALICKYINISLDIYHYQRFFNPDLGIPTGRKVSTVKLFHWQLADISWNTDASSSLTWSLGVDAPIPLFVLFASGPNVELTSQRISHFSIHFPRYHKDPVESCDQIARSTQLL